MKLHKTNQGFITEFFVARADRGYTNNIMYRNQQRGTIFAPLPGDTYRRKILAAEVKCRNLGID
ncbi:MAG: hypothetical protein JSW35_09570 [Deltaproteobacteria bacterium]|nr:MAG: hypothetical protein JSW35_09570 [Deltaproteobacteria bacterium]